MTHRNKSLRLLFALLCALCLTARFSAAVAQDEDKVGFKWGFAAKVGPEGSRQFVPIRHDTVMHSGDSIKMVIELTKMCYVYVFYQGATGEMNLLFPYKLTMFAKKDYVTGKNYFIPQGQAWSYFDENTGKERFHVLASPERLTDLEVAYTKYVAAKEDSIKKKRGKQLLAQISATKKQNQLFASAAERPINIGGNVRGLVTPENKPPDVTDVEVAVTAKGFYSKTYTINHQK